MPKAADSLAPDGQPMTGFAIALVVIASAVAAGAALVVLLRVRTLQAPETAPPPTARPAQGALVPVSSLRPLPDLSRVSLEHVPHHVHAQAALVIQFNEHLSSELQLARTSGRLSTIKGPAAQAMASLLNNPKVMDTVLGKAGYYLVKASPGAQWMTANGVKVAQEAGKAGQAGTRAVVIGGAAFALGPELAAVALAATAEYILTAKIEQVGKAAELIHHRQMAEALGTADQVLQLVQRLREYDDPSDWPEVLIAPLVTAHNELSRQAFAAARLRDLILSGDPEGTRQPAGPGAGDRSGAFYELAAGYELYAVATQAAAARLVHAHAHGDDVTTAELEWQLHRHIEQLRDHHKAINDLTDRKSRWFKQGWGRSLGGLREANASVISLIEAKEFQFVLAIDGPRSEMLALPAAPIRLSETAAVATETTSTTTD